MGLVEQAMYTETLSQEQLWQQRFWLQTVLCGEPLSTLEDKTDHSSNSRAEAPRHVTGLTGSFARALQSPTRQHRSLQKSKGLFLGMPVDTGEP